MYNNSTFVENDPISIPHRFSDLHNREIMAFWVAMLSWGNRTTIINKASLLIEMMDGEPYDFITNHQPSDLKVFETFKHRTFQPIDALYFIDFFRRYYSKNKSLENAFLLDDGSFSAYRSFVKFHHVFFDTPNAPQRTRKHVSTPLRKSACKRLCMFLRWMVRKDKNGVDFGVWKKISPSELMIPLDVHVYRVAQQLNLIKRKKPDWIAVEELTNQLKIWNPDDPVIYDYALFGIGVHAKKSICL